MVFTYGPLGFLSIPVTYFRSTWYLSVAYVVLLQVALCFALLSALRRSLRLPLAGAVAFIVATASRVLAPTEVALAVFVLSCVLVLGRDGDDWAWATPAVVAGGAVAGFHVLMKFNTGLSMLLVGAVTVWVMGRGRWRSEVLFGASAAGMVLIGWIGTGNRLTDLGLFLRRSLQVASGYSEAMGTEEPGRRWEYFLAFAVVVLLASLAWAATRNLPTRRRLATGAVTAIWLLVALKHGFVRHDAHSVVFFGEALVVCVSFCRFSTRRPKGLGVVCALLVGLLAVSRSSPPGLVDPRPAPGAVLAGVVDLLRPHRLTTTIASARERLQQVYGLNDSTLAALAGQSVHIHPLEASIAWAYPQLHWDPLPVFQAYSAYTSALDEANAAVLAGSGAPERILAGWGTIDGRYADWDPPAAMLAMACHYVQSGVQGSWQLLTRTPERCGAEQALESVRTTVGQEVVVPPAGGPDRMVVARIRGLDTSFAYRLRAQLLKIPPITIVIDRTTSYRLVPGTAGDGLVLSAPQSAIGWSPPFAFPSSVSTLQVRASGWGIGTTLRIDFSSVAVS
jgi:hypothetical protein